VLAAATEVVAVVTQPDRPSGRGHKLTPTPVKRAALKLGLAVYEPLKLKVFADELRALDADVFAVASYGRILPQSILDLPKSGIAFNVHPSLLPLYRGATPLQSAIRDGRTETGVTIMAMDAGMDTGDILNQSCTRLGEDETYGELHDRLANLGAERLREAIAALKNGKLQRTPQSATAIAQADINATLTRPLTKDDTIINWSQPAKHIFNLVRSLAPLPAARATVDGEQLKVLAARVAHEGESTVTSDDGFVVPGADGAIVLLRVVPPNRGPMTGAAYHRAKATA
jgi:methionyl-tRNA formyltransferase